VIAGLKGDLAIVEEGFIHERGKAKKPADGGLSAKFAIGAEGLEFLFVGEPGFFSAEFHLEEGEVDAMSRRQGAEDEFAVDADEDGFDDMVGRDVLALSEGAGGEGVAMARPGVTTATLIKEAP